ncbi:hypothetical protein Poly41_56360 [Novipirellula artificiosorum]|uniref:Uncharacterized protein n=1 Tax=Novipirellula artificiosorum TaxID=2528016 RepID=A0A5C6D761_9BACT|nr:hypothetical protein Poly41_56360 [Novipirellula artificiosorum]
MKTAAFQVALRTIHGSVGADSFSATFPSLPTLGRPDRWHVCFRKNPDDVFGEPGRMGD